jgi:hypothetical protein
LKKQFQNALLLAVVFLLTMGVVPAQDDEGRGILGYTLGTHLDSIKTLLGDGKSQNLARYKPIKDSLSFDGILTQKVRLFFFNREMHSIDVKLLGKEGDKALIWLKAMYGEGKKRDAMGFSYVWELSDMVVMWEQNLVTHDGLMTLRDNRVHRKYYNFMSGRQ